MTNTELIDLLVELTALPTETEWVEFKMNTVVTDGYFYKRIIRDLQEKKKINHRYSILWLL